MASEVRIIPWIIGAANYVSIGRAINSQCPDFSGDNLGMPSKTPKIIPERLIKGREERGWNTAELARQAKLSQPTVWAIENGITQEVKHSTVAKLASAIGKSPGFLTGDKDQNTSDSVHYSARVPVISWVQAGKRNAVTDPFPPGASEEWEDSTLAVSSGTFALRVRGDSMVAPDGTGFPDGAIIIVDPAVEARNGDFVVVRFENSDEATFKKLVVDGPLKLLKPLNPTYPHIPVTEDARLAGVVVEVNLRRRFR